MLVVYWVHHCHRGKGVVWTEGLMKLRVVANRNGRSFQAKHVERVQNTFARGPKRWNSGTKTEEMTNRWPDVNLQEYFLRE